MSETRFGSAGVKVPSGCVLWQQRDLMRNLTRRRNCAAGQAARPVGQSRLAQDRDRPRVGFGTWLSLHGDQRVDDVLARDLEGEQQIALED